MKKSVIIIGGGIGGLFTGAFLAKNGLNVTVLEKNIIIGGGLQCFRRKDKIFETGMHVMGGFEKEGNLHKICSYLGILDSLDIHHIDPGCMDEITYWSTGDKYRIPSGREQFTAYFAQQFPDQKDGLEKYVDAIYNLTREVPLFYLQSDPSAALTIHSEQFTWPADRLIREYISDQRLQEILAYLNPLYGGVKGHTPAYVHALINVLYINGASRFIGGSQQLADALNKVITDNGGDVISPCEVKSIEIKDKSIVKVKTANNREFSADWYISSIHPVALLRLLPKNAFLRGYINRLNEIPVSYSAFSLFVDLKPGKIPYIDHTCYFVEDYGSMWTQDKYDPADWPKGFMYMTPPDPNQGKYANRMLVHCIMSFDQVRQWENSTLGHRPDDYIRWKQRHVEMIVSRIEKVFPGFKDAVANIYSASPLTIRDYYHTKDGAIFGYRKDSENIMISQLPVYTKIKNLLLTGQNINLHGICGVPLTAISTAEAILGPNTLLKQINNVNE